MQSFSSCSRSKPDLDEGWGMKQKNSMRDSSPAGFKRDLYVLQIHVKTTGPDLLKLCMCENFISTKNSNYQYRRRTACSIANLVT